MSVLVAAALVMAAETAEVRAHPVALLDLEAAAEVVRPLLGPGGRVVVEPSRRQLIVIDTPAAQQRVADALRRLEAGIRNVRIRVRTSYETDERHRGAEVSGRRGPVSVGRPRRGDGIEVRGGAGSSRTRSTAVQEVLALTGSRAEIRVATETPYADWLLDWSLGHGLVVQGTAWQEAGTSLVVTPTLMGDGRVRLRLTPRLVISRGGTPQTLDVAELSTEVVVAPGEEVDLGGLPMADESFRDRFFVGFDEGGRTARVRITVSTTVD